MWLCYWSFCDSICRYQKDDGPVSIAAAIYITGILGLEMYGAAFADQAGKENLGYTIIFTIEEVFEMSGITLLIYALLDYLRQYYPAGRLRVEP